MSVCPQCLYTKSFLLIGTKYGIVGRDKGMMYDPIQGQGHRGLKCAKMADFNVCLFHQYTFNGEL